MAKVYLHIGSPKTGTTYLQSFLGLNSAKLIALGVLYPETGKRGGAHHDLADAVSTSELHSGKPKNVGLFDKLLAEIERASPDYVIVSSEDFFAETDIDELRRLLGEHDVEVVTYLRDQEVWYQNMVRQAIKQSEYRLHDLSQTGSVVRKYAMLSDYDSVLTQWRSVFGENGVRVFDYDREKSSGRLLDSLANACCFNYDASFVLPSDPGQLNISIEDDQLELVRLANLTKVPEKARGRWLYELQRIAFNRRANPAAAGFDKFRLDIPSRAVVTARAEAPLEPRTVGGLLRACDIARNAGEHYKSYTQRLIELDQYKEYLSSVPANCDWHGKPVLVVAIDEQTQKVRLSEKHVFEGGHSTDAEIVMDRAVLGTGSAKFWSAFEPRIETSHFVIVSSSRLADEKVIQMTKRCVAEWPVMLRDGTALCLRKHGARALFGKLNKASAHTGFSLKMVLDYAYEHFGTPRRI